MSSHSYASLPLQSSSQTSPPSSSSSSSSASSQTPYDLMSTRRSSLMTWCQQDNPVWWSDVNKTIQSDDLMSTRRSSLMTWCQQDNPVWWSDVNKPIQSDDLMSTRQSSLMIWCQENWCSMMWCLPTSNLGKIWAQIVFPLHLGSSDPPHIDFIF